MSKTDSPSRPRKPPGWYGKAARAERAEIRAVNRRRRLAAERARASRKAKREALIAGLSGSAKLAAGRIILAAATKRAKEPPPKKKVKKTKAPEPVVRTVDAIAVMARRGQIDQAERRAAERYRDAFDIVQSHGMKGTLDPDKSAGGGTHGVAPPQLVLDAAEALNHASALLGKLDGLVVEQIVGKGRSIEEFARQRYGGQAVTPRRRLELVRARLADALTLLAGEWFPAGRQRNTIVGEMAPGAKPIDDGKKTSFERMRVAHAGGDKSVSYTKAPITPRKTKRA